LRLLLAILYASISRGLPLDPQPADSFTALCQGPWMHADASAPYKGVASENNGSGRCCAIGAEAFMCIIHPGHQHAAVEEEHLRFYDGVTKDPRLDILWLAAPNPGMNPRPDAPQLPPYAELALSTTSDGFALAATSKKSCAAPIADPAKAVCANTGQWVLASGIPKRP
jgi:hypothetical protein